MASSPTQRSLALLRAEGYAVEVTERWNPHARRRVDLFGIGDLLALGDGCAVVVQTTSASNMAARRTKIANHDNIGRIRAAGLRVELHGWRKNAAGKWVCNREDLS